MDQTVVVLDVRYDRVRPFVCGPGPDHRAEL